MKQVVPKIFRNSSVALVGCRRYKQIIRKEEYVLSPGPAKKIAIHLNEDTTSNSGFLSDEILSFLFDQGVSGASVIRPEAGFGSRHRMHGHTSDIDSDHQMPVRIEFVETAATVEALLPRLQDLVTDGMIESHDTTVLQVTVAGKTSVAARTELP